MKRILFSLLLSLPLPAAAFDIALGQGNFSTHAALQGLMEADVDLDVTTISLSQSATPIGELPLVWSVQLELFQSAYINQVTDFASQPVSTDIPFFDAGIDDLAAKNTPLPVPADYRVYGMDLNIRLAWPLLQHDKGHIHLGVNTGLTLPFMQTRNMRQDANVFLDLLETSSTEIRSYKLGPMISASWALTPAVQLQGRWTSSYQRGTLDNDLLGSSIDITGSYSQFDVNIRIQPAGWPQYLRWLERGYILAGYQTTRWDYDKASFSFQQASLSIPTELDMEFSKSMPYLGLGVSLR